jgi:hydroxymethylbilane synthase
LSEKRVIRVGCRGTEFCRAQTAIVLGRLAEEAGVQFEFSDFPGANGEDHPIQDALAAGMIDMHIRGARELPIRPVDGVELAACTTRVDPFDVLVSRDGDLLEDLQDATVVGVESARVAVQLGRFLGNLEIRQVEGTVDRLMQQLEAGEVSAFVVAAEDVETLRWEGMVAEVFTPEIILPAAGQGSFAVLVREGDAKTREVAALLDDETTRNIVLAERAFLRELDVRMSDPVAVHGEQGEDGLVLRGLLADTVSGAVMRDELEGELTEAEGLGIRLAKLFVGEGARDYLASYR